MKSDALIMASARGEECLVRIPGCRFDPAYTVLAHSNDLAAGRGYSHKSFILNSAYACDRCHDVIDGRRPKPDGWTRNDVLLAFYQGGERTRVRMNEKGLL